MSFTHDILFDEQVLLRDKDEAICLSGNNALHECITNVIYRFQAVIT